MSEFWKTWLTIWCGAVIVFGAVLVGAASPATDAIARAALAFMSDGPFDTSLFDAPAFRFAVALLGAVTLGWGSTVLAVVRAGRQDAALWRAVTAAVVIWYAVDSAASIATGFALNAVSNTLFLAAFVVALLASGAIARSRRSATAQAGSDSSVGASPS